VRGKEGKGGKREWGEGREEGDGRTNPKPAATGLYYTTYPAKSQTIKTYHT